MGFQPFMKQDLRELQVSNSNLQEVSRDRIRARTVVSEEKSLFVALSQRSSGILPCFGGHVKLEIVQKRLKKPAAERPLPYLPITTKLNSIIQLQIRT